MRWRFCMLDEVEVLYVGEGGGISEQRRQAT